MCVDFNITHGIKLTLERKAIRYLLMVFILSGKIEGATCVSTGNTNWGLTTSWSNGSTPTCNDSVVIMPNHTITINSQQNYNGCSSRIILVVKGTLYFVGGNKLRLPCNSKVYIFASGSLDSDGAGASNQLQICNNTYWEGSEGRLYGALCFPPALPGCANVLPIKLVHFDGDECGPGTICLKWQTGSEQNNDYFSLERSVNGVNFIEIARIKSQAPDGDSKSNLFYTYTDDGPTDLIQYYRLKQFDFDGSYSASHIIEVRLNLYDHSSYLFPNPNNGQFYFKINSRPMQKRVRLILSNGLNQVFYFSEIDVQEDKLIEISPANKLPTGAYVCSLSWPDKSQHFKFVVVD
jgi:hypothetical protein